MESSRKKSGGVEIPKRNRSLDLKGDCESQFSKAGGNKRKISSECDVADVTKKKRKIPKEVPLSSFVSDAKKSRKMDDGNGSKSKLGSREKPDADSKIVHGVALPLGGSGNSFHIPKRPRGLVGRKRPESDKGSESRRVSISVDCVRSLTEVTKLDSQSSSNDQSVRSAAHSAHNNGTSNTRLSGKLVSNTKCKKRPDSKPKNESTISNVKLNQIVEGDEVKRRSDWRIAKKGKRVVNNGNVSRKKKDLDDGRDRVEASTREPVPTSYGTVSNSLATNGLDDEDDEDDEENLEGNAARMLSSRFDPSCTGYSSKMKLSASQRATELNGNSVSLKVEATSGGDNLRSLRPKRGNNGIVVSKKRRHFYEVLGQDVDPHWVLKQRIKIFCPLDDRWYGGVVKKYRSKANLHHIKYDDRDEEWVNLKEERFKLLLLRSEVPGKVNSRDQVSRDKNLHTEQIVSPAEDESSIGNSLDSEPIALWLAKQSLRVKSLPKSSKRLKTSEGDFPFVSSLKSEKTNVLNDDVKGSDITGNRTFCECASADNSLGFGGVDKSLPEVISKSDKHLVYVRKKNQKKFARSNSVFSAKACSPTQEPAGPLAPDDFCLPTSKLDRLNSGHVSADKGLWAFGEKRQLTSYNTLLELKEFRFQICLPLFPWLEFSCRRVLFRLFYDIFWLQHGVIVITSPSVIFELLLIDDNLGLRLLQYEGCLKQALAIVFKILSVFGQYDEQWNDDEKLPATSITFRLSSVHDQQKQHVFFAYCFSKLKRSMWLYLESKILQQCHSIKHLRLSECTDDNLKELDYRILQPLQSRIGFKLLSSEDFKKKREGQSEACNVRMSPSPPSLTAEPRKVPQSPLPFLNLHLHSLMQNSLTHAQVSTEQNRDQPIAECAPFKLSSNNFQNTPSGNEINQSDADDFVLNSSHMGFKSSSKRGKSSKISFPLGIGSPVWSSGKPNFMPGPKKPRTQVQYTLPLEGYDTSRKQEMSSSWSIPFKRIRKASMRAPDVSGHEKNLELLSSSVNVLVTNQDRGWRECGANVSLEVANDNEWRLAVKLSGVTRFSYKVKHVLQPGSANRYTHAMMWRGGKDWVLEFPERGQWMLFKEMYEECYNQNIRAASVKNIPIPGVRLVDEYDDCGHQASFVRNPVVYFRQVQSDAELAMDPSRVLYDMDSDDEQWLIEQKKCADKHISEQLSDNFLETAMDMFEKVAYSQHREDLTDAEVEELVVGVGSIEAGKLIYQHWRRKREKMGMPLIRHFQPPPWERYQRQLKEWEQNVAHGNCIASFGGADKDKPPMFAFCSKPRGLDVPNRGSKHRSHRKFTSSGNHHAFLGDRDSLVYGRRTNGHAFGGRDVLYMNSIHEVSDIPLYPSARVWSPRDEHYSSTAVWKVNRKISKNKHKRLISHLYSHSQQVTPHNHMTMGYKNGVRSWDLKQLDISNLDEFHLRDALGAVQYTCKMAKFKREKAQHLICKADIAIHKAVSSLMNAEAMKDSFENLN
ncbi:Enhancer of polycomb-like transcription factor protein [Striga hermonthica]|uniref:Enhancer of polycomb-like protein n=1 Tax=Striga hermonthica TaxID=68872 RepID=A0A9N7RPG4_STRHE|nr:Enhancer of polycomb-like transcription factor protein [Striga hermonthica]